MNVDEMVAQAKTAYRAGQKAAARDLLLQAVQQDPNHQDAWLWLSGMVETLEDQQICLENVLALNPTHERARKGLAAVERKLAERAAQQPAPPPPPPPKPDPEPPMDWGEPVTSVEWGRDDGPAVYGSGKQIDLPSQEEYDAWVQELHLSTDDSSASYSSAPPFIMDTPSPFGDTTYMVDSSPFLGGSPLMAERSQPEPAPDDLWPSIPPASQASAFSEPSARVWPAPPPEAPPAARRSAGHEFSFDDDDDEPLMPPAPSAPFTPRAAEPVAPFAAQTPAFTPEAPTPQAPTMKASTPKAAHPSGDDLDRYFAYIPADVTAEPVKRRGRLLNVVLIVLFLADAVAVAALISAL